MKIALRLYVALVFASFALAQTAPKDVYGWGKIKWGMTVTQAKAAYGPDLHDLVGTERSSQHSIERLVVDRLPIGDISLRASLYTDAGSDHITEARLQLPDGVTEANGAFHELLNLLTHKYGKPTRQNSDCKAASSGTLAARG
jgi:hypothetical protein